MTAKRTAASAYPRVMRRAGSSSAVVATASAEMADGLSAMLSRRVTVDEDAKLGALEMRIELGAKRDTPPSDERALVGDAFAVERTGENAITIRAGSERGLIHAAADLLQRLGAVYPPGAAPQFPRIKREALAELHPYHVAPAFSRRAFVSDIMTWNYSFADRLELHLRHDREFIPWMARRGVNAFSYIRHAHDTRLRIDEIAPIFASHGIDAEYGGHVLPLLLPRERFETDPAMFPADDSGARMPRGNLCISNRAALDLVRAGALRYAAEYPENHLLHIWGADVKRGAWCRCGACREVAPQLQYMAVVNSIAEAIADSGAKAPPVTYLAYHDTIDPIPGLRPMANVWVEWAPRERCYSHAIDDHTCEINPRYFDSLKRYIEIFDGRAHVFEYYADAILFGGLGFATPAIVARDMRAYKTIGIDSVSCLTFGAFSTLAYPANLEAFVRCAQTVDFDPDEPLADAARGRHPGCADAMTEAYRAVETASLLALDYADVMSPQMPEAKAASKRRDLANAARVFREGIAAAETVIRSGKEPIARAEQHLWTYSAEVLDGISEYLAAKEKAGAERMRAGEAAIGKIADAIGHVRAIDLEIKGTWGAYDLEWIREMWLSALKRGLENQGTAPEEIF